MPAFLHAFGMHVPERVVTNEEMAGRMGRTAEWIEGASGIRERRWAAAETSVADLAVAAANDCLGRAGVEASALGLIIVASGERAAGISWTCSRRGRAIGARKHSGAGCADGQRGQLVRDGDGGADGRGTLATCW